MNIIKGLLLGVFVITACFSFAVSAAAPAPEQVPETVQDIEHINHPTPQFFTSGQPTEAQLEALAELGVKHVVNLRSIKEMQDIPEASWATQQAQAFYHIPISGPADLTYQNVEVFNQVLAEIGTEKTLMHCASSNRVGAMMALRAAWMQGASRSEALQIGTEYGLTSLASAVEEKLEDTESVE